MPHRLIDVGVAYPAYVNTMVVVMAAMTVLPLLLLLMTRLASRARRTPFQTYKADSSAE